MLWFLISLLTFGSAEVYASCGGKRLPFEERKKQADLIFIGKMAAPLEIAKDAPQGTNRMAKINVIKAFKGEPGKQVDIYVNVPPLPSCSQDKFDMIAGDKIREGEILFFVKSVDGKHMTSFALGSHYVFTGFARKDLQELLKQKKK